MGGCRCIFRKCESSTATKPTMHFFHFPHKDLNRATKWCEFANTIHLLNLPIEKLRNKVICEMHFRLNMFMNYKKDRLIKIAVPTLLYTINNKRVDLEKYNVSQLDYYSTLEDIQMYTAEVNDESNELIVPEALIVQTPFSTNPLSLQSQNTNVKSKPVLHNSILLSANPPEGEITLDLTNNVYRNGSTDPMSTSFATINFDETKPLPIKLYKCRPPKFKNHSIQLLGSQTLRSVANIEADIVPMPHKVSIVPKRSHGDGIAEPAITVTGPTIDSVEYNNFIKTLTRQPAKKRLKTESPSTKNSFNEITSTEVEVQQVEVPQVEEQQTPTNDLHELNLTLASQIQNFEEFKVFLSEKVETVEGTSVALQSQLEKTQLQLQHTQKLLEDSQKQVLITQQQLLNEQKSQHEHLLQQLDQRQLQPVKSKSSLSPKLEKNAMKKEQLFNGIKRYLNPAAVALLRLEMFGSGEREYKNDEKNFAVELLTLGNEVYDYFIDEWRFRLPPKQAVNLWKEQGDADDEIL